MELLGGTRALDSFLKAYETKDFLPYEWFNSPDELKERELPSYDLFVSIQRNSNPLEKHYADFENLGKSGLSAKQELS